MNPEPVLRVEGAGVAHTYLVDPGSIDFGPVAPGCTQREVIHLYHRGRRARVSAVRLGRGTHADFSIVRAPTSTVTFRMEARGVVEVSFNPSGGGPRHGSIEIVPDDGASPIVIPLFGEASDREVIETHDHRPRPVDLLVVTTLGGGIPGLDRIVETLFSEEPRAQVSHINHNADFGPWHRPLCPWHRHGRPLDDMPDDAFPPRQRPERFEGACGYFAIGPTQPDGFGEREAWRILSSASQPSPTEAIRRMLAYYRGSFGQIGYGMSLDLHYALSEPLITGWNRGFLRREATLGVVFYVTHALQLSEIDPFIAADLRSVYGSWRPDRALMSSIFDGPCPFDFDGPFLEGTIATPRMGGLVETTCEPDAFDHILAGGLPLPGRRARFELRHRPEPSTLEVRIDGRVVPQRDASRRLQWWYQPEYQTVRFDLQNVPPADAPLELRYRTACEP
jgi:hypothetical protein